MSRRLVALFAAAGLLLSGCATISDGLDAINPFASSGPKMAPLPAIKPTADVRNAWTASVAKAGDYTFTPAVIGNAVYAASAKGTISRIEDGKTLWRAKVSSEVLAAPVIGDDGVAVKSGDNQVFLLDAVDGGRKWAYQRATPPLSVRSAGAPVFADRYLFVGYPGGKLVALALQNGAPVWEGAVASPKGATELDRVADVVASPVVDGRQICAVAFQGRIACFDMGQGGAMVWSRDISSASGLGMDGRYLFVTDDKGYVYGLDRLSGSSLWKQDKLKGRRLSAPIIRRGLVAVADGEGIVHFLSREDGSFAARQKTDGTPVRAPLQALGSTVLVQTSGGEIDAIEVQ